jgi:outer membrane protein assembly factor BamB
MIFSRLFTRLILLALFAIEAMAADWPQWRGPRRDGVCDETGLLQRWPEGGPPLKWSSTNLGRGYSAPILVAKRIYLTGDVGAELHIFALDLEGKRVWQAKNGHSWKDPYPGARASCTFSEGRLYHLSAHGRLVCLDAESGKELWSVNVLERFEGKVIHWGLSENLLVEGPRVIVTPGGSKGLMAALDKRTGETAWASSPLRLGESKPPAHKRLAEPFGEVDSASYASPILVKVGSRRLLVNCSLRHVFGVDADTGELLWTRPMPTRHQVIATTPVLSGDGVFVTAPHGEGGRLLRLRSDGSRLDVSTLWRTDLDACQGGAVVMDGIFYGAMYSRAREWVGLDARTGEARSRLNDFAKGSLLAADGRLYCLSEQGEVALLNPGSGSLEVAGRFRLVPERKNDAWTHPVIANGRLYLRYQETLFCYDIRRGEPRIDANER